MSSIRYMRVVWLASMSLLLAAGQAWAFQLGSRTADEWIGILDGEARVEGLKIDEVITRLELSDGDIVADIGAGTGVFSGPLARAVAPSGILLAVEIDQGLLDHIDERADREGDQNVQTVLGEFDDPRLPRRDVDLAFFHDVLHHVEDRAGYLGNLGSYLKDDGRIVVIDQIAGHRDQPEMQMTLEDVKRWMASAGFGLAEEIDLFENKFFAVFERN